MKTLSALLVAALFLVTTPFALARAVPNTSFAVDALVTDGKKSKEVESSLNFAETSFKTVAKNNVLVKEFNYADVQAADYSYAKKPLLSTGGKVASVIFLGVFALPLLFQKKKQHWLTIRTEKDYVVMKLDKDNFRQILSEFEVRKVSIKTVDEDSAEKAEKKKGD